MPTATRSALTFVWRVNGTVARTFANASALTDTLDLSLAGNGDPGDTVPRRGHAQRRHRRRAPRSTPRSRWRRPRPTVYASDTFTRTVDQQLGHGHHRWRVHPDRQRGRLRRHRHDGHDRPRRRAPTALATLAAVSAQDVDLSFRVATDKDAGRRLHYLYGVVRRVNATNAYRLKLRFAPNGAVFVHAAARSSTTSRRRSAPRSRWPA